KGRHDRTEYHHQTMHGGHLVKEFRIHHLHARVHQLGADNQRQQAADQEHGKTEPQVQGTDVLVVGGKQPTLQAMRGVMMISVVIVMCCGSCSHCRPLPYSATSAG